MFVPPPLFWVLCASCPVCWSKHLWTNLHFSQGSMLLNPGFGMHSTYIILMLSVASHFVISLWIKSSDPFSAPICAFPCFLDFLGCVFVHFKERYHSKTWLSLRYTSARHFVVEFGVVFDNFLALHSIFTTYPLFCMLFSTRRRCPKGVPYSRIQCLKGAPLSPAYP